MQVVSAKRGGLVLFPREISAFPSKTVNVYINADGFSLRLELLFSEDTNTVSKLFCMILLYVYSYLLSTSVFRSVWELYRSVITYNLR